jgi:predicted porin
MKNNLGVKTNGDADGWGISYQHAMSKRTTAYVGYVDMSNDRGSQIRAANVVSAPGAGQDSSGFAMGMRHTF